MLGIFGDIKNPFDSSGFNVSNYTTTNPGGGLIIILSNLYKVAIAFAGVYTLINFILAGYGFLSAGGDTKLVQKSQERIWRSVLGLAIVAGAMLLARLVGIFIFYNATTLYQPRIFTP
jgi:NhaP-type Na+/H+ or K+/H+ antiporter